MRGKVLKFFRQMAGYTVEDLIKASGLSRSYISALENNKKNESIRVLEVYAKIANVKVSDILKIQEDFETENWDLIKLRQEIAKAIYLKE